MAALATLLPQARTLSWADKLQLIQLLAQDLAELDEPARLLVTPAVDRVPRFHSPRLAHPDQAIDFVKQVREVAPDAAV